MTLAARCAGIKPEPTADSFASCSIVFPAKEWGDRDFAEVLPPVRYTQPDGSICDLPHAWELRAARTATLKKLGDTEIREIVNRTISCPQQMPEEKAKEALKALQKANRYWPAV